MIHCPLEEFEPNRWRCPACEWVYPLEADDPPKRNCPRAPGFSGRRDVGQGIDVPSTAKQRAKRLAEDIAAALLSGRATRSAVQIEACLVICRPCGDFAGDGCRVYDGCNRKPRWLDILIDAAKSCPDWDG